MFGQLKTFHAKQHNILMEEDFLLWGMRVIVSKHLQNLILRVLHQDHPGSSQMKLLARSHPWWLVLDLEPEKLAKSCTACLSVKQAPAAAPLRPWVWPSKPWQHVHEDFAGPFMYRPIPCGGVIDMAKSTTSTSTVAVAALRHLLAAYGFLQQEMSDNGPQFTAEEFTKFLQANGYTADVHHIIPHPMGLLNILYALSNNNEGRETRQTFNWISTCELPHVLPNSTTYYN